MVLPFFDEVTLPTGRWPGKMPSSPEVTTVSPIKICSVKPIMYNCKDPTKERYTHLEEVSIRYRKITWTYLDGNLQASDSWSEGR